MVVVCVFRCVCEESEAVQMLTIGWYTHWRRLLLFGWYVCVYVCVGTMSGWNAPRGVFIPVSEPCWETLHGESERERGKYRCTARVHLLVL